MSEYRTLFDARGARYNRANRLFPEARAEEARQILGHCRIPESGRWLDVGAGGGFLAARAAAAGLTSAAVGCDESAVFLAEARGYALRALVEYVRLPFPDGAFAASGCLAALHHVEEPRAVLREMLRVTAPGRRAAVGDVAAGSAAARFLNGFVDEHTESGHAGRFYDPRALAGHFEAAGGSDIRSEEARIRWRFAAPHEARTFFRELFGLKPETGDGEIDGALGGLGLSESGGGWAIPWAMVFASAVR